MATRYTAATTSYEPLNLIPGATDVITISDLSDADDAVATINLGSNSFRFYDTVYTSLTIDSNGRIILGTGDSEFSNTDLTSTEATPGIIAPFWDDLQLNSGTAAANAINDDLILYQIDGNRLILEWNNAHFFEGGTTTDGVTFQAILQLNTGTANGAITFNYVDLTEEDLAESNGTSATIGLKAPGSQTTTSLDRTLISFNQTSPLVGNGQAIQFTPETVDPNAPFITSDTSLSVAENTTDPVYTITANAPANATLTYSLSGTDADQFTIDTNSGVVSFANAPDFEAPNDNGGDNVYDITVTVNNGNLSDSQEVAITVTDEVEATPTDTRYIAATTAYESLNLVPGAAGVTTVADLSNADDAVATINLGSNSFRFYDTAYTSLTIDSNGRIILGTEDSAFENTDLTSLVATPGIIAPFWDDLRLDSNTATENTAEDDLVLYQIDGNRLIVEWNNVHFFEGGTTTDGLTFQAILQLNTGQDNGAITFNYPDLIEADLADNNGTFATVGVKAPGSQTIDSTDRTLVSFNQTSPLVGNGRAIRLTPETVDPNEPIITSDTSLSVAENTTDPVYTITATAPENATLTYSLSGTDADQFTIDANSGVVSFANVPDFEAPTDAGGDNVYDITVIVNNGSLSDSQDVVITVTDEIEAAPSDTRYTARAKAYENLNLVPGAAGVVTVTDLSEADDAVATINLGSNSFRFYDTTYTSLTIDTNGRIILGTDGSEYQNTDLTSAEPTPGIIAPFWDDLALNTTVATAGTAEDDLVLYKIDGDRLIVEWNNAHFFNGGQTTDGLTFQSILQLNTGEDNGKITFNYVDLTEADLAENNGASATIGIKAPGSQTTDSTDRTLVSLDETSSLVGASRAIVLDPSEASPTPANIIWRNPNSGDNFVWFLNQGTPTGSDKFAQKVSNPNWKIEGIGDFDQDGAEDDLVWRNYQTGSNSIWLNDFAENSVTTVGGRTLPTVPNTNWKLQGIGDFDQDTFQDDLIWFNPNNGRITVWFMEDGRPTGNTAINVGATLGQGWEIAGVGSFDGNLTQDDLLWRNYQTGRTLVWFMDGTRPTGSAQIQPQIRNTDWRIEGVSDFNGDQVASDILWRNYASGTTAIWFMDGTTLVNGLSNIQPQPDPSLTVVV